MKRIYKITILVQVVMMLRIIVDKIKLRIGRNSQRKDFNAIKL